MRYFLEFAYKGTDFKGWQIQPNAPTVQAEINRALSLLLREEIGTTGSGRTDAGVHASQQFLHFDFDGELDDQLVYKLNKILPHSIPIYRIIKVHDEAHARFDATQREYEYFISPIKQAFSENQYYHYPTHNLDIELMNKAGEILLEYTDFEALSKVHTDVNTFLCKITKAAWTQEGQFLKFHVVADRFLRGMVRTIVGTLLDVGQGKTSLIEFREILESKNRKNAGRSVPANGLFLSRVVYPYIED